MSTTTLILGTVLSIALLGQGFTAAQSPVGGQPSLLSGVIVDRAGTPLKGAQVIVEPAGALSVRAVSDERGRFAIASVAQSAARLVVRKAGYAPAYAQLSNIASGANTLVLTPGAVLTGIATDSLGRPVQGFIVRVRPLEEPKPGTNRMWRQAVTDDQGRYRLGSQ